jgi:hypothetical protein
MTNAKATSRDERRNQSDRRASLAEALRRYRKRRDGYEQMRSGNAPQGIYRPQRGVRRDYRV